MISHEVTKVGSSTVMRSLCVRIKTPPPSPFRSCLYTLYWSVGKISAELMALVSGCFPGFIPYSKLSVPHIMSGWFSSIIVALNNDDLFLMLWQFRFIMRRVFFGLGRGAGVVAEDEDREVWLVRVVGGGSGVVDK